MRSDYRVEQSVRPGRGLASLGVLAVGALLALTAWSCKIKPTQTNVRSGGVAQNADGTGNVGAVVQGTFAWTLSALPACFTPRGQMKMFVYETQRNYSCNPATGKWQ